MPDAGELLDQLVSTFNEAQWEAGEALWADHGVTEEIGTGRTLDKAAGTQNAKDWKAAFPDARGTIENRIVAGNQAVGEVRRRGTNTGPLMGMPPTGKPVDVRAAMVVTEEGGKLVRLRHYLDVAGMMAQLGVAPGGQTQAPPMAAPAGGVG
jgi:steroid delta-isomerase-like uncharacterized protein